MDNEILCGECGQQLGEGARVYFDGVDYHEACFTKENEERGLAENYFMARGGIYR